MFSALMSVVYHVISAVLLFWHSVWERLLGDPHALGTDWTWVLGIVFLVLTVRTLLLPLFLRQVKSQRAMQRLQPRFRELQDRHRGDALAMRAELADLYRREQVSPFGGFLPMLLQVPILIGLLHVLRHLQPGITGGARLLYGWSAAQFDDASHAKLFGAPIAAGFRSGAAELAVLGAHENTVKIVVAVLIAAMVVTTYLTSRMSILRTGWSENPQQRTVQRVILYGIPLSLLVSGLAFPVGVILYWTTQNLFALGQQLWLRRRYPMEAPAAQPDRPTPGTPPRPPRPGAKPQPSRGGGYSQASRGGQPQASPGDGQLPPARGGRTMASREDGQFPPARGNGQSQPSRAGAKPGLPGPRKNSDLLPSTAEAEPQQPGVEADAGVVPETGRRKRRKRR